MAPTVARAPARAASVRRAPADRLERCAATVRPAIWGHRASAAFAVGPTAVASETFAVRGMSVIPARRAWARRAWRMPVVERARPAV